MREKMTDLNKTFPGYIESQIHLIAHRGYTPAAPENSLAAFQEAAKRRFWAIETDVRKTVDGHLVCIHDAKVDNTYEGCGNVSEMTLEELQRLKRKEKKYSYEEEPELRIPLFTEYLAICRNGGAVPFIEMKTQDIKQVLKEAEALFAPEEIVISSAEFSHLEVVRTLTSQVFIHHIFSNEEYLQRLAKMGKAGLSYNYPRLDQVPEGLIQHTHDLGVSVCLRAGDSLEVVRQMCRMELDYIPTNVMDSVMCRSIQGESI